MAVSQLNSELDICLTILLAFDLDTCIIPPMAKESYKQSLDIALSELSELMDKRDELEEQLDTIDARIFQLREGLFGLAILCGTDTNRLAEKYPQLFPNLIPPDTGLTDAIRKALSTKRIYYSPVEVRDRLEDFEYDLSKYKNILPSIHTVLKRLVDSDEVETGNREGKVVYRWRSAPTPGNGPNPKPARRLGQSPPIMTSNPTPEGGMFSRGGIFSSTREEKKKK